jgi:hypothetical protein
MSDKISIGGAVTFQAIDESGFALVANGTFGGGYAKITQLTKGADGSNQVELQHYFLASDGSYVYTQDKAMHTPVTETRYAAVTEYRVVAAGGKFAGMIGSMFNSIGILNYSTGFGVVRLEGEMGG